MARIRQTIYLMANETLTATHQKLDCPLRVQIYLEEETFCRWNVVFCKQNIQDTWFVYHVDHHGSEEQARVGFSFYEKQMPLVAEFDNKGKYQTKIVRNGDKYNVYVDGRLTQDSFSAESIMGYLANAAQR